MHRLLKWICSFSMVVVTFMLSINMALATEYEVVFRAGNHGSFEDGSSKVVIDVEDGKFFPSVPDITVENGYMFTGWNKEFPAIVDKQVDFVAQYKQLINGKEYAISYVDTFGNPLATKRVLMGEFGESVEARAKVISGYIVDAIEKTLVIKEANNEIIFIYTSVSSETIYNDVVVNTPGTTPQAPGGTLTPDIEEIQIPEEETPLSKEEVDERVEEEETPLNKQIEDSFSTPLLALGVGLVLGLLILIILKRRSKKDEIE